MGKDERDRHLSRIKEGVYICPDCGTAEALLQFANEDPSWKPISFVWEEERENLIRAGAQMDEDNDRLIAELFKTRSLLAKEVKRINELRMELHEARQENVLAWERQKANLRKQQSAIEELIEDKRHLERQMQDLAAGMLALEPKETT